MKKYNPVQYNRTLWFDQNRIKNHPRNCKQHHRFCSIDYQWSDNTNTLDHMNNPINQVHFQLFRKTINNITLPTSKQRALIKHQDMTEQGLDDWLAQSINRTLNSMLNPNKKFFIPSTLDQQLKTRYSKQRKKLKLQRDDTYFKTKLKNKQQKSYLTHKKNKTLDLSQLYFNYKNLSPKRNIGKTLITARQQKTFLPKKQIRRRNGILLQSDIHYQRFVKQAKRQKDCQFIQNLDEERKVIEQLNTNKIYTFNYQSLRRRKCNQDAPGSITEYQGIKIALQPGKFSLQRGYKRQMMKQQQQQQAFRLKGNARAQQAYSIMENFSERSRRSKRKNISSFEQRSKQCTSKAQRSTFTLFDVPSLASHKTQKKVSAKAHLGRRVIQLLDDMHVQPQNINVQMTRFQMHPQFLQLINIDSNNMSHKWIKKAQTEITKNNLTMALDCYKQAIIIQPQFFNPVFNFAALLQRDYRFNCSLEWFRLAQQFRTDSQKVAFAIALINFKMEKFEQSLKQINDLILELTAQKKNVHTKYYYIRALCLKKFEKHQQAKRDYKLVLEHSKPSNSADLTNFIISQIFAKKRRLKINVDCLSYISFHQLSLFYLYAKSPKLREQGSSQLIAKIKNQRFFKRFPVKLIEKIVKTSSYEYFQKDDIIFVRPNQCIIVLDGLMVVKNHQKNILSHQIVSLLQTGDFIGANKIDNFRNLNLNNWYFAHTQIELLRLKSLEFQSLWKGQISFQVDYKYNYFKNNVLFQNLSDNTLFKLCELMSRQKYLQGTVLFNDGSYRKKILSKIGSGFSLMRPPIQPDVDSENLSNKNHRPLQQFSQQRFGGIFIVIQGKVQVQDDMGFSNSDIIGQTDFFGQNLILKCDGLHNYGRLLVASQQVLCYQLKLEDVIWCFSSEDKEIMQTNCLNMERRKSLGIVKELRRRYHELLGVREKYKRQPI